VLKMPRQEQRGCKGEEFSVSTLTTSGGNVVPHVHPNAKLPRLLRPSVKKVCSFSGMALQALGSIALV
jgi:hypothetical protein